MGDAFTIKMLLDQSCNSRAFEWISPFRYAAELIGPLSFSFFKKETYEPFSTFLESDDYVLFFSNFYNLAEWSLGRYEQRFQALTLI